MDFDDEIIHHVKSSAISEGSTKLEALVLSNDDETVLNYLDKRSRVQNPGQAVTDYVRALFFILGRPAREDSSSRSAKLLMLLVTKYLTLFQSKRIPNDRKCIDCFDFFVQEMDALPKHLLPSIAESLVLNLEAIIGPEDGYELQLLPRVLRFIMSTTEVRVPGQDGEETVSSGAEYAEFVLKRMLHAKWSKVTLTRMVSIMREMQLEKPQVEECLSKVFSRMKGADPQDLPSLVYQLLLFASKGFHKKAVLEGIVKLFEVLAKVSDENGVRGRSGTKNCAEIMRQVEGTVLLHMNFAIKQDPSLGQELLNVIRNSQRSMTSFTVALLLSIARIQRFEEGSMGLLRTLVLRSHQDYKQARDCRWLPDVVRAHSLHTAKAVEQALLQAVQYSSFGRDHIIPSVVRIGFALLESFEAGKMSLAADSVSFEGLVGSKELGIQVLQTAFEVHEMARNEIIEQSKFRIISLKPQQSSPVIRLLDQLVQQYPHLLLEHAARLKECLDYFTFLNSLSASSLIRAICPLFQMSRDLQNYTVLVLRKAMFGREEAARMAATRAIIDLIISEKQFPSNDSESFPSSSQASCSQQTKLPGPVGLNLFQELKGLLRRCLSQQARVKEAMYKGLVKLVLVDPAAAGAVFDLLWPHFLRFCIPHEDGGLLLKLGACVKVQNGIVSLDEPLDYLLSCVHQLLVLQPQNKTGRQSEYSLACFGFSLSQENEVGGIPAGESFANAFINLRKSLRSCKLEEYSLDKTQNFCLETPEGEKNVEQARVFLGILEVLMNIAVSDMKNATDANPAEAKNELKELLELYGSLEQSALRKQGGPRKSSTKPSSDSKGQTQEAGTHSNLNLKHGSIPAPPSSTQERIPFLTTSNIAYLLEASVKLINTDNISSSQPTSQHRSQGASRKQTIHHFKLASFALRTCLRHLKAFSTESLMQGESQNPLKALVFGDMKVLGGPLLQLMCLLKSTSSSVSTQEKTRNKESRVKKASDEAGDGLIHTAVLCMDMLCKSSFTTKCLSDVLEEMLSVSSNEEEDVDDMDIEMEDIYENESESPESKLIHLFLWKKIRPLLVDLLMQTHFREFEVLCGTALFLGGKLPSHLRKMHGTWADLTCRSTKLVHNGAARALATLAVYLCIPPLDLTVGKGMACELLKVTGSEERDAIDVSDVYFIINTSTRSGIVSVLLQLAEATLVDLDWLISKLKVYPLDGNVEFLDGDVNNPRQGNVPRSVLEETLHSRVESLVRMLFFFTEMSLDSSPADHFLRVALKLYKLLAAMTKLCIAPKGYKQSLPSSKFELLAEVTCRKLTAPLYNFMAVMQRDQQENLQAKGVVNKIKRECKTIPNLIFHMEDYEKYLIQLSKVTKVNLMRHAKRSTARDFKILDTSKKNEQDDNNQPDEANQSDAAISGNESQEESERVQADGSQDIHSEGNVVAEESKTDSDNDSGMKINMARKRKINSIVQDSDEE